MSYLCFLCHNTVITETNEETRDRYKEIVGIPLCPDSHLCHICSYILKRIILFKLKCLKRSLEYPVLFSINESINLYRTDIHHFNICAEYDCKSSSKYLINLINDNNQPKSDYDTSNDYVKFNFDNDNYDVINDNKSVEVDKQYSSDSQNDVSDNDFNDESYNDIDDASSKNSGESENDIDNLTKENNDDQSKFETEIYDIAAGSIPKQDEEIIDNDSSELNEIDNSNNETVSDIDKKWKKDKKGKPHYKKMVLTLKEQKQVLDKQRKEKKYIEAEFKCHSCALGFLFKDTYQSHMMRHEESNGQYSCPVCGLRFATQNAKCMHLILHSELHKCSKCSLEVKRTHKNRHTRVCWGQGNDASCHLCGKRYRDPDCLQQHLKRFHAKSSGRVYSCHICGEGFKEQSAVRTHMVKHLTKKFACDICQSSFTSPYTLRQHKKSHGQESNSRSYCTMCNAWFSSRKGLLAHLKRTAKHQKVNYDCSICGKNCPNQHALSLHIETHSSIKRHNCPICGTSHTTRKAMTRHLRSHYPTEKSSAFVCHVCGSVFKSKYKLQRHIKEVCEKNKQDEQPEFYDNLIQDLN